MLVACGCFFGVADQSAFIESNSMRFTSGLIASIALFAVGCSAPPMTPQEIEEVHAKAMAGDAKSQNTLGWMYSNGEGVAKDEVEAVKWLLRAASQGSPVAQCNLGICFEHGYGVPRNKVEAYAWYNLCSVVREDARDSRDNLERLMTSEERLAGQERTKQLERALMLRAIKPPQVDGNPGAAPQRPKSEKAPSDLNGA